MKNFFLRRASFLRTLSFCALVLLPLLPAAHANVAVVQRREHLTPQEVEMVRDTQELDRRSGLFIKIAERRLVALTNSAAAAATPTLSAKEIEKWGELPKGTRAQLLGDLARIFDEAIVNVDDVAARSPDSALLPKVVRNLAGASTRFLAQLTPLRTNTTDDGEREALEQTIDNLQQIIDAAKRLPEETTEKKGEKKKN
jgi:hypothetical protein